MWYNENNTLSRNISNNLSTTRSIFETESGEIYIGGFNSTGQVNKRMVNSTFAIPIMYTCIECFDIFVDINNTLYCSMNQQHRVVAKSLGSNSNLLTLVAGTGSAGSTANMLNEAAGIFVDSSFNLYVADAANSRVQMFKPGELNGITVAGSGSLNTTIILDNPTSVILDADGYLFIMDKSNLRIVGSGSYGFRCLVGCSTGRGSAPNQLDDVFSISFDSYGNIYVADFGNKRIQKFLLVANSCSKYNRISVSSVKHKFFELQSKNIVRFSFNTQGRDSTNSSIFFYNESYLIITCR